MYSLVLDIKIPIGIFREPGSRFYAPRSIPIPPPSALIGMLMAIDGVGRGKYGVNYKVRDKFVSDVLKGMRIGLAVEKLSSQATFGIKDFLSNRLPWQPIIGGWYKVIFSAEREETCSWLNKVRNRLLSEDIFFPPYAGMTSYPMIVEVVRDIDVEPYEIMDDDITVRSGVFLMDGYISLPSGLYVPYVKESVVSMVNVSMYVRGYGKDATACMPMRFVFSNKTIGIRKEKQLIDKESIDKNLLVKVSHGGGQQLWVLSHPLVCG